MKWLVDMPLPPALAGWLRERGHDAVHASDVGLERAADAEIAEWARRQGRVVATADLDYPRLLAVAGAEEPGLVLFRGGNFGEQEAIDRLRRVLESVSDEDLLRSVTVVERHRVRRRYLPLRPQP